MSPTPRKQTVEECIIALRQRRAANPQIPGIKGIVYRDYEARAFLEAAMRVGQRMPGFEGLECLMVGDSYLTTHLGRASTRLSGDRETDWFVDTLASLTHEVAAALRLFVAANVYLVADLPDGAAHYAEPALRHVERLLAAGADAVKIEVAGPRELKIIERLAQRGVVVQAHLGYQPQHGPRRRYAQTLTECVDLFSQARAARDHGARALVLEMVSEEANRRLAAPHPSGIPVYSIFSGKATGGGQSLNAWDAVVGPDFSATYFPPTATLTRADYPHHYTEDLIAEHVERLIEITLLGEFPRSPPACLSEEDQLRLATIDVWGASPR